MALDLNGVGAGVIYICSMLMLVVLRWVKLGGVRGNWNRWTIVHFFVRGGMAVWWERGSAKKLTSCM